MENILSYIPVALIVIGAVFAVLYGIDEKLAKKVAIRTLAFVVAVVAFALILTLHGAARAEWVEATVVESIPAIYEGEECYLISVNIDGEVKSYYSSQNLAEDTVIEVDYVDGKINNSREPEPIWFPPILMVGAVAPIVRKKKVSIKQKMCPDFFMTKEKYENGAKQHIAIDLEDNRSFVWVYNPDRTKQLFAVPSGVDRAISEATRISPAAFVTTFVPAYGHQAVVFCNYHDHLGIWINTSQSEKINEARKLLAVSVQTINDLQIVNTPDKLVDIVKVKYSQTGEGKYSFYPIANHQVGDFVCVQKVNQFGDIEYKNVQITAVGKVTESKIREFCKRKGYKDLGKIYCRHAIDLPGAWADWGGSDPRIATDEEPQDYDFEADFFAPSEEEIADFQAMREAYGYRLP